MVEIIVENATRHTRFQDLAVGDYYLDGTSTSILKRKVSATDAVVIDPPNRSTRHTIWADRIVRRAAIVSITVKEI